jgi:hypothetical protein
VNDLHRSVIVAVVLVWVMQTAVHEVTRVIAVGNGFMPALGAVDMIGIVGATV